MTTAPSIAILRKPADHLNNSILPTLKELGEQLGGLDEMEKEIAKKQAQLDTVKHNLKIMRLELDEVKGQYNDMVKKANEEVAKLERARREREVEEKKLNDR
jgi:septal ring factor EnvC (AmiA/AmiB activator)